MGALNNQDIRVVQTLLYGYLNKNYRLALDRRAKVTISSSMRLGVTLLPENDDHRRRTLPSTQSSGTKRRCNTETVLYTEGGQSRTDRNDGGIAIILSGTALSAFNGSLASALLAVDFSSTF